MDRISDTGLFRPVNNSFTSGVISQTGNQGKIQADNASTTKETSISSISRIAMGVVVNSIQQQLPSIFQSVSQTDQQLDSQAQGQSTSQPITRSSTEQTLLIARSGRNSSRILATQTMSQQMVLENQAQTSNASANGFNIDSVVGSIFDSVTQGYNLARTQGASERQMGYLFEQTQVGINQGTDAALNELGELFPLANRQQELTSQISATRTSLTEKLTGLQQNYVDEQNYSAELTASVEATEPVVPSTVASQSTSAPSELESNNSASGIIRLRTKEGDRVSIQFTQSSNLSLAPGTSDSDSMVASSNSLAMDSRQSFAFRVRGDISEDEQASIGGLLNQITNMQQSFFDNDIEGAFEQVNNLAIDFGQISRFSMSLSLSQNQSQAQEATQSRGAQSYAAVARYTDTNASVVTSTNSSSNTSASTDTSASDPVNTDTNTSANNNDAANTNTGTSPGSSSNTDAKVIVDINNLADNTSVNTSSNTGANLNTVNKNEAAPTEPTSPVQRLVSFSQEVMQLNVQAGQTFSFSHSQFGLLLDDMFQTIFAPRQESVDVFKQLVEQILFETNQHTLDSVDDSSTEVDDSSTEPENALASQRSLVVEIVAEAPEAPTGAELDKEPAASAF